MSDERFFKNPYPDEYNQNDLIVDKKYWLNYIRETSQMCMKKMKPVGKDKYCDGGLYTGNLGLIFMCFKIIESKKLFEHENEYKNYMIECLKANEDFKFKRDCSFLLGKAGYLFMGCFVSKLCNQESEFKSFFNEFVRLGPMCEPINFLKNGSDELFVGRAGYLSAILCMRKYLNINNEYPKDQLFRVCNSIIESGRKYSHEINSPCPLIYQYHGSDYLGAAHGLSGIFQILLSFADFLNENQEAEKLLKQSVDYILTIQKSNGNFPTRAHVTTSNSRNDKELVHWCHGAGGLIFLMGKAYLRWKEQKYLDSALRCGELIWRRGLLRKGPGICHGIGGNGLAHLLLYRLTNDSKHLYRANKFAQFLTTDEFISEARTPDCPYSLFEGLSGTVCFIIDLLEPNNSEFPLLPLF